MTTKKHILCIEDEAEMIELMRLVLEREGHEVMGAVGGEQGLKLMREKKPDLILLDLMMPGIDGWEVYRQMRADKELTDIPVIIVTAKAQSIDKVLGLQVAKVADYITKPFGPKELIGSIERVFAKQNVRQ
ncbi:MAG: response regulator [Anaerolineae bacterium]|nr:response regulator [Anaerolineae bacterium]